MLRQAQGLERGSQTSRARQAYASQKENRRRRLFYFLHRSSIEREERPLAAITDNYMHTSRTRPAARLSCRSVTLSP